MERHIGQRFKGRISGVRSFGFFVRLDEYFVEGLVHAHDLEDDYYEFHENSFALIGRNTGRRFRLADPVVVEVTGVNKEERQIDFTLVEGPDGKPGGGEKRKEEGASGRPGPRGRKQAGTSKPARK
jgi:ribonuclease R